MNEVTLHDVVLAIEENRHFSNLRELLKEFFNRGPRQVENWHEYDRKGFFLKRRKSGVNI